MGLAAFFTVTNLGGLAVILADKVVKQESELKNIIEQTLQTLNLFPPHYWSHRNPVDIIGDTDVNRYIKVLQAGVLIDLNVIYD